MLMWKDIRIPWSLFKGWQWKEILYASVPQKNDNNNSQNRPQVMNFFINRAHKFLTSIVNKSKIYIKRLKIIKKKRRLQSIICQFLKNSQWHHLNFFSFIRVMRVIFRPLFMKFWNIQKRPEILLRLFNCFCDIFQSYTTLFRVI